MRWLLAFATVTTLTGQVPPSDPVRKAYAEAISELNAGRLVQARTQLEALLVQHRDYFRAYKVYWDSIGRTKDTAARRVAVERDLAKLENVPLEGRTEDFYESILAGYRILGNPLRAGTLQRESIARYPRGLVAQQAVLNSARLESDPAVSVLMYGKFIQDFPENKSWIEIATRDRFELMAAHSKVFDLASLRTAADEAERGEQAYIGQFGNPASLFLQLKRITEVFAERDPATALLFAQRGLIMVQDQWPRSEEISEKQRIFFWPSMLKAHVALKNWIAARRIGEALVKEMDLGSVKISEEQEKQIRTHYAEALKNSHLPEAAHIQQEMVANLARSREQREEQLRAAFLKSVERRPAQLFSLKGADGGITSLKDLRGKVVVVAFWATWCGPCLAELDQWKLAWNKYKEKADEIVLIAVNTDSDKTHAAQFAQERGYAFPIVFSDGTVEAFYRTSSIPQLYLIDRAGDIRFHQRGYSSDGFYLQKLDFMIESLRK